MFILDIYLAVRHTKPTIIRAKHRHSSYLSFRINHKNDICFLALIFCNYLFTQVF